MLVHAVALLAASTDVWRHPAHSRPCDAGDLAATSSSAGALPCACGGDPAMKRLPSGMQRVQCKAAHLQRQSLWQCRAPAPLRGLSAAYSCGHAASELSERWAAAAQLHCRVCMRPRLLQLHADCRRALLAALRSQHLLQPLERPGVQRVLLQALPIHLRPTGSAQRSAELGKPTPSLQ